MGVGQKGGVLPLALIPALAAVGKAAGLSAAGAASGFATRKVLEKVLKPKKKAK